MTSDQSNNRAGSTGADAQRRTWERPTLTRLRAGEAELGANPANPEQAFAMGS